MSLLNANFTCSVCFFDLFGRSTQICTYSAVAAFALLLACAMPHRWSCTSRMIWLSREKLCSFLLR